MSLALPLGIAAQWRLVDAGYWRRVMIESAVQWREARVARNRVAALEAWETWIMAREEWRGRRVRMNFPSD